MRSLKSTVCIIIAVSAVAAVSLLAGSATIFINYPTISPNGDGIRDEMTVLVTLSAPVDTLTVDIRDKTAPAIYQILLSEIPAAAGDHSAVWDGTDWTGATLPEGEYDLHLYESTGSAGEHIYRTVIIDLTSPAVIIDRIEPGVHSPGWPDTSAAVTVYFSVSGWEEGAAARMTVRDPSGLETVDPVAVQGDGDWTGTWKPAAAESGFHTITITVGDEAGNSDADSGSVYVDSDGPEIEFLTDIPSNTPEVPGEIIGRAFDPSGVTYLELSWTGTNMMESGRFAPDSTWTDADTLYWRFDTPDTVTGSAGYVEGGYVLKAFAKDAFEIPESGQLSFKLDRTAPSAPYIDGIPAKMIQPALDIYLSFDDDTDSLFVYHQSASGLEVHWYIAAGIGEGEPVEITLEEGLNELWATARDRAGNTSAASNTVSTTLDPSTGITYPEVFRGPGSFQVVSAETASSVTVEIYDMRGERIRRMVRRGPAVSFEIPWDLTNDDGEMVKNGACLVVIVIETPGGSTVDKSFIAVVR